MTFTDYLVDSLLILIVFRQLRESRLDRRAVLLPLIIVAVVGKTYLHDIPTGSRDLALIAGFAAVGLLFGSISALATRVRSDGGQHALVKAGAVSAGVWVASMGFRMVFAIWANTHAGEMHIGSFSMEHGLSTNVWAPALVLMALAEVVTRVGLLVYRGQRAQQAFRAPTAERTYSYPAA